MDNLSQGLEVRHHPFNSFSISFMDLCHFTELVFAGLIFALQEVVPEGFAAHDFASSTAAEPLCGSAASF